jgi:hypothetical protein
MGRNRRRKQAELWDGGGTFADFVNIRNEELSDRDDSFLDDTVANSGDWSGLDIRVRSQILQRRADRRKKEREDEGGESPGLPPDPGESDEDDDDTPELGLPRRSRKNKKKSHHKRPNKSKRRRKRRIHPGNEDDDVVVDECEDEEEEDPTKRRRPKHLRKLRRQMNRLRDSAEDRDVSKRRHKKIRRVHDRLTRAKKKWKRRKKRIHDPDSPPTDPSCETPVTPPTTPLPEQPPDPPRQPPTPDPIDTEPDPPVDDGREWVSGQGFFVSVSNVRYYTFTPPVVQENPLVWDFDEEPNSILLLNPGQSWETEWNESEIIRGLTVDAYGTHRLNYSYNGNFEL